MSDATAGTSTIHDLGYRRYSGERVGAEGAWSALFAQSVRAMFGIGRPLKSKAIPILVMLASMLPSLAMLAAASASNGQLQIRYAQMIEPQLLVFVLFMAAQVPEVISRDQQHRLLPLLFTRDVTRTSYALARFTAIFSAVLIVGLAPLVLLYIGEVGVAKDPAKAFSTMGSRIWPVLGYSTLSAFAMSGIGAALACWTSRRAYATATIFGSFLLLSAISAGVRDLTGLSRNLADFIDPLQAMRTMARLFFGETNRGMEIEPPPAIWFYIGYCVAVGAASLSLFMARIRKINT